MNAGATALRAWRELQAMAPAAAATRLAISVMLYERIEDGEVIPEPWLRWVIRTATIGAVETALWDGRETAPVLLGHDHSGDPSVMLVRSHGSHLVRIDSGNAVLTLPMDGARALSRKLGGMFGVIDLAAVRSPLWELGKAAMAQDFVPTG